MNIAIETTEGNFVSDNEEISILNCKTVREIYEVWGLHTEIDIDGETILPTSFSSTCDNGETVAITVTQALQTKQGDMITLSAESGLEVTLGKLP